MHLLRTCTFGIALALGATGCQSAGITATLSNATAKPVSLLEVDYPSASFGLQSLNPGADYTYRFKIQGAGPIKLTYSDGSQSAHQATGPTLREGDHGSLRIVIANDGVHWSPAAF